MKYIHFFLALWLFAGCKNQQEVSNNFNKNSAENLSEITSDATENAIVEEYDLSEYEGDFDEKEINPIYNPSRTLKNDIVHTKLEVSFDWSKSRMNGIATITAKPHFYETDSLILDAKGMDIKTISLNGKELTYTYDSLKIQIKLDKKYKRTENYTVTIEYVAKPEERKTGGSMAISSDKGLYFVNPKNEEKNKMPQIWTQGETEANSVWFPTIDSPNAKSTQEIFITVDDKYTTLSNGKLVISKKNTNGTRTDHWKQDLAHAPYLFMMAVGEFKVVKDFYTRPDGSKMEVNYYVEPEHEQYAKAIFGETPAMIKHFSQLLGVEYPWDKYHQIVVRDYVSGAMENTGAVIFGDYVYKTDRELLDGNDQSTIAHELFHHWFGDYVTCESWANLPLNESFANYSQYLWDEHRYGLDEANYQAEEEAKGYYNSSQGGNYHNLINFAYFDKEEMFDGHSYNKGGRILHMLRNYLGDEAFFKGMNLYLTENKYKAAEVHHLRLAFEEVSGEDLNWFFNQWFLGKGHPILQVYQSENKENQQVTLNIVQKQKLDEYPLFQLPVDVQIIDEKGKRTERITITEQNQDFTFSFSGKLMNVLFDVNQVLLGNVYMDKPNAQFLNQYQLSNSYKLRAQAIKYAERSSTNETQQLIVEALKDPFWNIRLLAVKASAKLTGTYLSDAEVLIKSMVINDPKSSVRSAGLDFLSTHSVESAFVDLCNNRINSDKSYAVLISALSNLSKINKELGLQKANDLAKEKTPKLLVAISAVFGDHGTESNFVFFENIFLLNKFQGFDELNVISSLLNLCLNTNARVIEKSYTIFDYLKKEGNSMTQMYYGQIVLYISNILTQKIEAEMQKLEQTENALEKQAINTEIESLERLITVYDQLNQE